MPNQGCGGHPCMRIVPEAPVRVSQHQRGVQGRGMDIDLRPVMRTLRMYTACLALLSCGVWTGERWSDRNTVHFDIPLTTNHWLHVHFGDRFLQRYFATFPEPAKKRWLFAPLQVRVAHRSNGFQFGTSLVSVPTWPPQLPAAMSVVLLAVLAKRLPSIPPADGSCGSEATSHATATSKRSLIGPGLDPAALDCDHDASDRLGKSERWDREWCRSVACGRRRPDRGAGLDWRT